MNETLTIILYAFGAGICIPIGGALGYFEHIKSKWLENEFRHSVIAFGGGIMLAAVALVLVPEGTHYISHPIYSVLILLLGGISFFLLESYLGSRRLEKPQFTAMLLDFIPESLALGGALAVNAKTAPLLAIFIGLQNLPEGFNAYRELRIQKNANAKNILLFMLLLAPLGPMIAFIGWYHFSENLQLLGATMLFAAGGILYLIFQDIAPQAHLRKHWAPSLGAVLGFCLGMFGNNLVT
ncbi:MAG: ZIP family metal transporter [Methylophilaceae bacterium]